MSPAIAERKIKHKHYCESFKPFVHDTSRVLILGSMPGPEALRKQQYYGFNGNHFWTIVPALFGRKRPDTYPEKLDLLRSNAVAVWDVLESCVRPGAADSAIKNIRVNAIPELLEQYPKINAVFVNGQTAHKIFLTHFKDTLMRPVFCLPSSSPANAMMSVQEKIKRWEIILKFK